MSDISNGGTEQAEGNLIIGMIAKELVEEMLLKEHGDELRQWLVAIIEKVDGLLAGIDVETLEQLYNKKKQMPDFSLAIALMKTQQKEDDA